ncbi:MAG: hypothetical protein GC154_21430 [bacterium]|nr:hypothetical protein [bacterium]
MKLNDLKMKPKLITLFLIVGLLPLTLIGWWSTHLSRQALTEKSYNQLEGMRDVKKLQIEKFFNERQDDMAALVETVGTLRREAFNKLIAVRDIKKRRSRDISPIVWN